MDPELIKIVVNVMGPGAVFAGFAYILMRHVLRQSELKNHVLETYLPHIDEAIRKNTEVLVNLTDVIEDMPGGVVEKMHKFCQYQCPNRGVRKDADV